MIGFIFKRVATIMHSAIFWWISTIFHEF